MFFVMVKKMLPMEVTCSLKQENCCVDSQKGVDYPNRAINTVPLHFRIGA